TVTGPQLWDPAHGKPLASASSVTVDQTNNLVNQMLHVTWANFTPSVNAPYASHGTVYPVMIGMQGHQPGQFRGLLWRQQRRRHGAIGAVRPDELRVRDDLAGWHRPGRYLDQHGNGEPVPRLRPEASLLAGGRARARRQRAGQPAQLQGPFARRDLRAS